MVRITTINNIIETNTPLFDICEYIFMATRDNYYIYLFDNNLAAVVINVNEIKSIEYYD